jgi:hypothetical protein
MARGRRKRPQIREGLAAATFLLALAMVVFTFQRAHALIIGGEGNSPVADPGWPKGAAAIFNTPTRIAWWEGPPFGGGQWHAECRGDAKALGAILAGFARMDVKNKRLILHDGVGASFWLNPNREPAKRAAAQVDWVFMVWVPANWTRLSAMPGDLNPTDGRGADKGPPSQIDVYTGGNVRWSDVAVPPGLEVIDQRLEAHGFTLDDGAVLEGKIIDLGTHLPIAARTRLERIEPQPKGGYQYTVVTEAAADAQGRWILKKAPAGWYRIVVAAAGFVSRVAGHVQLDGQPGWYAFDSGLARSASVSGKVTDNAGQPLADVEVRLADVVSAPGDRYESPEAYTFKTDADGRFRSDQVPLGRATVWVHKAGYCRPGLGQPITTPANDVKLVMMKAARLEVTVDFAGGNRPGGYIVEIGPERGSAVGTWGGSGNIDSKNQITFENIPPGRYVVQGRPNPSSANQQTKPITIDLKGGQSTAMTLPAR